MPKLTYKAIARMAGYRVREISYDHWEYYEAGGTTFVGAFKSEDEAWELCCKWVGLVEDE